MATLNLREEGQALSYHVANVESLSEAELAAARGTWVGRMVNEHVSAQVFAGMIPQMMRAGIRADRQAQVATMIADEMRHARQCAGMVEALGGEAVAEMPEIREMPLHKDAGPLEALLRNVLSICCLSETVAVSLISAEHLELQGGQIGQVLGQILGD